MASSCRSAFEPRSAVGRPRQRDPSHDLHLLALSQKCHTAGTCGLQALSERCRMVESGTDAAASAQAPQEPPPPLSAVFPAAAPGPHRRSLRSRWMGPAWCTGMVAVFAVSGYAWTLRPVASEQAPGAERQWQLARAAFAACAAVALVCLWVTHTADPGFLAPRCAVRASRCVVTDCADAAQLDARRGVRGGGVWPRQRADAGVAHRRERAVGARRRRALLHHVPHLAARARLALRGVRLLRGAPRPPLRRHGHLRRAAQPRALRSLSVRRRGWLGGFAGSHRGAAVCHALAVDRGRVAALGNVPARCVAGLLSLPLLPVRLRGHACRVRVPRLHDARDDCGAQKTRRGRAGVQSRVAGVARGSRGGGCARRAAASMQLVARVLPGLSLTPRIRGGLDADAAAARRSAAARRRCRAAAAAS